MGDGWQCVGCNMGPISLCMTRSFLLGERSAVGWGEAWSMTRLSILFLSGQKWSLQGQPSMFLLSYWEHDWGSYPLRFYGEEPTNTILRSTLEEFHCGATGSMASLQCWNTGLIPRLAQWVKDPALLHLRHRLQLCLRSDPWSRNSICCGVTKKEKRKQNSKRILLKY